MPVISRCFPPVEEVDAHELTGRGYPFPPRELSAAHIAACLPISLGVILGV